MTRRRNTYRYGYLDKVLSVTGGKERRTFTYHADGQLATATRTGGPRSVAAGTGRAASPLAAETETFLWDGLALIRRGGTSYVNEPHPNGGSPILSSKDGVMFNDILGTTVGTDGKDGYAAASLTAFGDPVPGGPRSVAADALFTGKPHVDGLGYAFLFRNYRPTLGKWQTADPLGYPDGWNQLAYCRNGVIEMIDHLGGHILGTQHYFLDIDGFWNEYYFYYAVYLQCECNHNYHAPKLRPFLSGGVLWEYDAPSVVVPYYDPILDEECSATVSVKSQLATSKQITTHYIGGIEVEIWANVYLEMVVMSENGERMSINSIEYKDKHFACFIEKEE